MTRRRWFWRNRLRSSVPGVTAPLPPSRLGVSVSLHEDTYVRLAVFAVEHGITTKAALEMALEGV